MTSQLHNCDPPILDPDLAAACDSLELLERCAGFASEREFAGVLTFAEAGAAFTLALATFLACRDLEYRQEAKGRVFTGYFPKATRTARKAHAYTHGFETPPKRVTLRDRAKVSAGAWGVADPTYAEKVAARSEARERARQRALLMFSALCAPTVRAAGGAL